LILFLFCKDVAFYVKETVRSKIVVNDQFTEHMQSFTFLGCKLTHVQKELIGIELCVWDS